MHLFPVIHCLNQCVRLRIQRSETQQTLAPLLPLLPFFIRCSCSDRGYCFDSVDGEQDVFTIVSYSEHRKPYHACKEIYKFGKKKRFYILFHYLHIQLLLQKRQTKSLNLDNNCCHTDTHMQGASPLLSSFAYPSAGSPTPSSPRRTSPAARLSPSTSLLHWAPGDSAGPWQSSVCRPGASAALPSLGGALRSRRVALGRAVLAGLLR